MNLFRSKNSNSTNHKSTERALILIPLVLVCFSLLPTALAVTPPPDGGYPGANTAKGDFALQNLTTGNDNTAIGASTLAFVGGASNNTAVGSFALNSNSADNNTATGMEALSDNTTGTDNTAMGANALGFNIFGSENTAVGSLALQNNQSGANTAIGFLALQNNNGDFNIGFNTVIGWEALYRNNGSDNTAIGANALGALFEANTGSQNIAIGSVTMGSNSTGDSNTAVGFGALVGNTTGSYNVAVGQMAGVGLTTGDSNIDIGNDGVAAEANTIRIGTEGTQTNTYIAGISGTNIGGGRPVRVNLSGHLGTIPSAARFKDEIKPMDKASEAILALKPVTFCYKKEIDPDRTPQFGLVAEEVEKVNAALVDRSLDGKLYSVRYEAVNAMLLNEFLKAHRRIEEQEATIARLQKQIDAVTAGLQEVSAQLEASKPAQQVVNNP